MTSEDLEDTYPHWKDALFGNHNAVANLRCAIHYVFWHSVYAMIAVVGVLVLGTVKVLKTISKPLGPLSDPIDRGLDRVVSTANYVLNHEYTEKFFNALLVLFVIGVVMYVCGIIVYAIILLGVLEFAKVLGVTIVIGALFIGALYALEVITPYVLGAGASAADYTANKARQAGEKAVETPGVRRVYGECPVSLDMAPKWFNDLFPDEEY